MEPYEYITSDQRKISETSGEIIIHYVQQKFLNEPRSKLQKI